MNLQQCGVQILSVNRILSTLKWITRQPDMQLNVHRWYAVSGDESYKEKAYRSLNWVTYCNDSTGMAFESPVSKGILSWWSDCYGECPRMFYHAFAAVPEWAPPREDHILYSEGILKDVQYAEKQVKYTAAADNGVEYLRLSFKPGQGNH